MIKKINKYKTIVGSILQEKREIQKLKRFNNELLNAVLRAYEKVKGTHYNESEKELFQKLENYRNRLNKDERIISYEIFNSDLKRSVKEICKQASSSSTWCQFHYCLAKELNSRSYLEIGTNLGISGSYLLAALKENTDSKFITLEGIKKLCEIAEDQFVKIANANQFEILQGLYDETFPTLLNKPVLFDTIFIDGNHQKEPTLHYFNSLKGKLKNKAVIIFDDINWSKEMVEAWEIIKGDSSVNYSIDLYKLGIVIIDDNDGDKNIHSKLFLSL